MLQVESFFYNLVTDEIISEYFASFYIGEAFIALRALHSKRIIYRDLKPENLLLDSNGHLLLSDFALSKVFTKDDNCLALLGTAEYMAPEVILQKKIIHILYYWSLGILLDDFLTGSHPFTC